MRHGRRVSVPSRLWLGVLSYTLREHVVIAGVVPGSPSEKAGLKQGDVVLAADQKEVHDRRTLYDTINSHHAGETITLRILRNNRVRSIPVTAIRVEDYLG
jgi:serine protease Do